MRDMGDLDAVHLGLDENEADIAEELQDFDDSFDTRSEASESGSESSDSAPSISSVSTAPSSSGAGGGNKRKLTKEKSKTKESTKKTKRNETPPAVNGDKKKKKRGTGEATTSKPKKIDSASGLSNSNSNDAKRSTSNEPPKKLRKKSLSSSNSNLALQVAINTSTDVCGGGGGGGSGNKSDVSDAEDDKSLAMPHMDSDSESEDSDSGANHKRNGARKVASKSKTPERNMNSGSDKRNTTKSYDYMTKLNYLFRDTRFFLIKSNNLDNVNLSKTKNVWATLPQNDSNLSQAYKEARNVLLIFSVNESGKFSGFARMAAPSRRDIPQVDWVLPPSISSKALGGVIELDWICRKELSFNATLHLHNSWNEGKPVKIGRDGQEIEPKIGAELCRLFPEDEKVELTPILKKSKEIARDMREKGIHVIYKPPRSLSNRGGGGRGNNGGGRGDNHFGPMRHKRNYGGGGQQHHHQRSHHRGYMGPHGGGGGGSGGGGGGGYKRNSSPYRPGGGGPHGGSRSGGGDAGMPSWERYMSSAAAAEAYVADYMRTMHGQLPPLPFVPPFANLPMPGPNGASGAVPPGAPGSLYEQLPPPVRYYDGPGPPPLPDYPPPQTMRPPPPGFDKAPSYEDFAAWKNAGLPTVPPPGFPSYGNSSTNGGNGSSNPSLSGGGGMPGMGSQPGNGIGPGPNSYRSRDNSNMSRSRDRRDYHPRNSGGGGRNNDRERFRAGGDRGHRYRDGRR